MKKYDIGIDLGGTNIAAGIVDEACRILCKRSVPTDLPKSSEEIVEKIYKLTSNLLSENAIALEECESIGIGIPGTVDSENGIVEYANNLGFTNVPFVSMLAEKFERKVYAENDAIAATIGEYVSGAGIGTKSMVMMTLGTGVGGGIIIDGRCWHGINNAAGELGHMVIHAGGRQCTCGRKGCLEAYASAPALIEQTEEIVKESIKNTKNKVNGCDSAVKLYDCIAHGMRSDGKMIIDAVRSGDEAAKQSYDRYLSALSEGVANIINVFQPECLVIGGGLSGIGETMLLDPIIARVEPMIYSRYSKRKTVIKLAKLGNDAGIIGAAKIRKMN